MIFHRLLQLKSWLYAKRVAKLQQPLSWEREREKFAKVQNAMSTLSPLSLSCARKCPSKFRSLHLLDLYTDIENTNSSSKHIFNFYVYAKKSVTKQRYKFFFEIQKLT